MKDEDNLYEFSFLRRLAGLGPRKLLLSYDTLAGVVVVFVLHIFTDGGINQSVAYGILSSFAVVSATLFALVLTGLTIITSFSSREFIYAWQEIGEFENIITYFQFNLTLPVIVLLLTFTLMVRYSPIGMIFLIALAVYMLVSLLDLVGLICRYALQRGEFVTQLIEKGNETKETIGEEDPLTEEELLLLRKQLSELDERE